MSNGYKCSFAATLIGGHFGCAQAENVVRRGGPEIACRAEQAHLRCSALFNVLKDTALPSLGFQDDLSLTPNSVYQKIQFGGLSGLARLIGETGRIGDIEALVARTLAHYDAIENIPCAEVVSDIEAAKLKSRRR
jgi:hypothetical protein